MDSSLFVRPNKPNTIIVRKRARAPIMAFLDTPPLLTVDKSMECHVTPSEVADRMVDYLELTGNEIVAEPQAGTGNIIQSLINAGHDYKKLIAIERNYSLCSYIKERFEEPISVNQMCFLEYAVNNKSKIFISRIIMNPPFKKIKQHIAAALSLLGKGRHDRSIIVALVPISYQHEDMEMIEVLPIDTFTTVKVRTKIVKFCK